DAVHPGHLEVEEDHVRPVPPHLGHGHHGVGRGGEADADVRAEQRAHELAHDRRVVDDQHVDERRGILLHGTSLRTGVSWVERKAPVLFLDVWTEGATMRRPSKPFSPSASPRNRYPCGESRRKIFRSVCSRRRPSKYMRTLRQNTVSNFTSVSSAQISSFRLSRRNVMTFRISGPARIFPA